MEREEKGRERQREEGEGGRKEKERGRRKEGKREEGRVREVGSSRQLGMVTHRGQVNDFYDLPESFANPSVNRERLWRYKHDTMGTDSVIVQMRGLHHQAYCLM